MPEFAEKAQKISEQLRDITQEQFVLTTNVRNAFSEVNNAGEILTSTLSKLSASNQQTIELNVVNQGIANTLKETVGTLQTNATEIRINSGEMHKVWNIQKEVNNQIEASMKTIFTGLNQGLSEYSSKTNAYMQSLDTHTAQISGHLVEAVSELKASVDDLKRKELAA